MRTSNDYDKLSEEEHDDVLKAMALIASLLTDFSDDVEKELASFYQKYGTNGSVSYTDARKCVSNKNRKRRILVLFAAISALLKDLEDQIAGQFEKTFDSIIARELDFFESSIEVSPSAWGADSLAWQDRLAADVDTWSTRIQQDLIQIFIRQRPLDAALAQIKKRRTTIENVVERLFESEATAVRSEVRKAIFKDMGITKYRFYTRKDERTCEICGAIHGKEFPMSQYEVGATASPLHPFCRCWEEPIVT